MNQSACVVGCMFLTLSKDSIAAVKMTLSCISETKQTSLAFGIQEKE